MLVIQQIAMLIARKDLLICVTPITCLAGILSIDDTPTNEAYRPAYLDIAPAVRHSVSP